MTENLDRYEILEEIGQGGFAIVHRALDKQLDRQVALKELRPMLLADPTSVKSFRQEAKNIARLDHPHVVKIYDIYEVEQRQFIVMQLVDGSSLDEQIATKGHLSWPEAVELLTALAAGLDYAHTRNVLHRDLKPANILLDSNHGPMLSDFGLAKLIGKASTSVTAGGVVVGTPHYIAPEVWEGMGTTRQSDIYALGCILYEVLLGEKLFPGETPPAVMMAHFNALTLPDSWPEGVPPNVADVLATALAQKPANRYSTAGEMAEALARLLKSELTTPQLEPARPETRPAPFPILATKLYAPPIRPEFVPRPRLIKRLNDGFRLGRKLTLISAPAGFGKTTLVSSWIDNLRLTTECPLGIDDLQADEANQEKIVNQFAWLSLDEGDNDPIRFLVYLVAALQTIAPNVGEGVLAGLQSPQPPSPESILTVLLNEIATIPNNFALVLDDYHVIDTKPIDNALTFLIEHLPPQMHMVIATREDPQLPLARYRVRGQLTELRAADLRFTPLEATGFLNQAMGLNLSVENIAALETRTEGWIAGLQLAAISMQGHKDATQFIKSFTGSHHFVLDYLVEEVLQQQSESVQTFLLRTSILNRLCGPLCDAVLLDATASGQKTLEYLGHANLFIIPLDNERRWYRYHHLFGGFLRQRLPQNTASSTSDEVDIAQLHSRASEWYEENGLEIEAFHHAVAANDIEHAERLIEGKGMPLQFRGGAVPILNWLESLPTTILDARPGLWVSYASALLMIGQVVGVEEKAQAAESALQGIEPDDKTRDLIGRIASIRATLAVTQHQIETIIAQAHRALEYLHPNNLPVRTAITWMLGYAYHLQGDRVAAGKAYTEAIPICEAIGHFVIAMMAIMGLGNVQEEENQLHLAAQTYRRALQLVGDPPPPPACEAYLGLARIFYQWNDLDAAQQQYQKSVPLAQQIENTDRSVACEVFLARLKLAQGDVASATAILTQASQTAHRHNFVLQIPEIAAVQVLTLLYNDKLEDAAHLAETHNLPISRARVHLAQGDTSTALTVLEAARQQAEARNWQDERLKVMVLQAIALHSHGEKEEAVQLLGDTLAMAEPGGFIRLFVDEGLPMVELLSKAAARRIMPNYTGKLLAAFENVMEDEGRRAKSSSSSPALSKTEGLVEPLSEREIEVLQLIAQGLSNGEISERLFLALSTVKGHNRNIFGKLQVQRRTEAVARARELGLV